MKQYIDKDALISKINHHLQFTPEHTNAFIEGEEHAYRTILSFLDSLEVKEADLEKALSNLDKDIKEFVTTEEFENESATAGHYWAIAKHAFLLGLKAQK